MATKNTQAVKKAAKEATKKAADAVKETAAKAEKEVKEATASVEKTAKKNAEKAVKEVKKATDKAEKQVKKATDKAEKEVKDAAKADKKTAKKAAQKLATKEVYFEFAGKQIASSEVTEAVEKAYVEAGNKASSIKSIKLYIKAEDSAVYYVINESVTGKIEL